MSNHRSVIRRRAAAIAAAASIAALLLAGCTSTSPAKDLSLTVQVQAEQLTAFKYAAGLLEKKHPGLKVHLQTITGEQKNTTNAQVLASSNAPDVGIVPGFALGGSGGSEHVR